MYWYLNLVRDGKSVSFGLIISDCYPGESTSGVLAICDSSDGSHIANDGLPYISIMQDVNLSNLPTDFDIHVDQIFGSKFDVQKAVTLLAIKNNFQFGINRSCKNYFWVSCVDPNCKWFMKSSALKNSTSFIIRKHFPSHTCSLEYIQAGHRQASSAMIGESVKEVIISSNGKIMTPYDIANFFRREFHTEIPYQKAWRARTYALDKIRGSSS